MTLPINELFCTIQGEASWTGTPSTFVRLQQCPVGCPWCDTKHTWDLNPQLVVGTDTMLRKPVDSATYANMAMGELVGVILRMRPKHVVLTGGEPAIYDLTDLTYLLTDAGRSVQIETSGTFPIRVHQHTWVTLSPKINMPGGLKVLPEAVLRADEIKMPIGKLRDIFTLKKFLHEYPHKCDVWLQPLSTSRKATKICIDQATENGWKLSIQTHKYLQVR